MRDDITRGILRQGAELASPATGASKPKGVA
jgi:hypothetical protein